MLDTNWMANNPNNPHCVGSELNCHSFKKCRIFVNEFLLNVLSNIADSQAWSPEEAVHLTSFYMMLGEWYFNRSSGIFVNNGKISYYLCHLSSLSLLHPFTLIPPCLSQVGHSSLFLSHSNLISFYSSCGRLLEELNQILFRDISWIPRLYAQFSWSLSGQGCNLSGGKWTLPFLIWQPYHSV